MSAFTSTPGDRHVSLFAGVSLRVGVVLAVLLMHGPSSGHLMMMPAGYQQISAHAGTSHDGTAASAIAGSMAAALSPTARLSVEATSRTGAVGHTMTHSECVATLPHSSQIPAPGALTGTTLRAAAGSRTQLADIVSGARGPPQLTLIRLCISRT